MPRIRPEIDSLVRYSPGLPIDEVARRFGISDIIKLASNESPEPPFPEVSAAMTAVVSEVNRYPDSGCFELCLALSTAMGIPTESLWFGAGSSELLTAASAAVGGPGTSFVFGWPSFALYPIDAALSASEAIKVPLDDRQRYDLDAMRAAIRHDTSLVFVCNPNNPTGTYRSSGDVEAFLDSVPAMTLVIVDEAYAEYVVADDYNSMIPHALERPNVVVARTFSKMYGLAGLRVGYMVGQPDTLVSLKQAQIPFSVNNLAQVAAITALHYPDRVAERVKANRAGVELLEGALVDRGIEHSPTQTNFLWIRLGPSNTAVTQALMERGVIVRPLSDEWTRVSVGTHEENTRFLAALDEVWPVD